MGSNTCAWQGRAAPAKVRLRQPVRLREGSWDGLGQSRCWRFPVRFDGLGQRALAFQGLAGSCGEFLRWRALRHLGFNSRGRWGGSMTVLSQGLAGQNLEGVRRLGGFRARGELAVDVTILAEARPPPMAPAAAAPLIKVTSPAGFVRGSGRCRVCGSCGRGLIGRRRDGRRGSFNDGGRWSFRYGGGARRLRLGGFTLLRRELGGARFGFLEDLVVLFLVLVKEVGNIEEGVALEADVHKRGLHAGEHTADAALVNAADQADVGVPFEINLDQLVVFQHGDLRLVRRRGNIHLLGHGNSFFRNARESTRPSGDQPAAFLDRPGVAKRRTTKTSTG